MGLFVLIIAWSKCLMSYVAFKFNSIFSGFFCSAGEDSEEGADFSAFDYLCFVVSFRRGFLFLLCLR